MSTATQVRPFRVEVPDEALADLRRRVTATRWPDPESVSDQSQGVQTGDLSRDDVLDDISVFTDEVRAAFRPLR